MEAMSGVTPILIVEPHALYRVALLHLVQSSGRFSVAAEASCGDEAVRVCASGMVRVTVLCVGNASDVAGIRALATDARVIAVSESEDGETVLAALAAGASAFLPKSASPLEILDAMDRVQLGEVVVHPAAATAGSVVGAKRLDSGLDVARVDRLAPLTRREREIVELLATGLRTASIAECLCVSRRTVEGHLANAYRKLGVRGAVEAVQAALRHPGALPASRRTA